MDHIGDIVLIKIQFAILKRAIHKILLLIGITHKSVVGFFVMNEFIGNVIFFKLFKKDEFDCRVYYAIISAVCAKCWNCILINKA